MDLADLRGLQPQIFPTNLKTEKAWVKNGSFFCYHIFFLGYIHNSRVLSEVRKYYIPALMEKLNAPNTRVLNRFFLVEHSATST